MKTIEYERVIPRDFFNEAKLLKCMGQLALKIHNCEEPEDTTIYIGCKEASGALFEIGLLEDGHLTVLNYSVVVNSVHTVLMKSTYNSKHEYPLICQYDWCDYPVFTSKGEFDEEFIAFCKTLKKI